MDDIYYQEWENMLDGRPLHMFTAALLHQIDAQSRPAAGHSWKPIILAPTGWGNFFLVRPNGIHPGRGRPYLPTVVQYFDGKFYLPDNELEPVYFGQDEPEGHPLRAELEWMPLPE